MSGARSGFPCRAEAAPAALATFLLAGNLVCSSALHALPHQLCLRCCTLAAGTASGSDPEIRSSAIFTSFATVVCVIGETMACSGSRIPASGCPCSLAYSPAP